ncbi:hypothetical protein V3H18_11995 [Methylocystis sp. 9N]|uniref:Uncharacterized protein n=1 Tax=Methylocystis borbori TaxID=3118750 RepID=A0ABU7XLB2_9HYPH
MAEIREQPQRFPFIPLRKAIDRARDLWAAIGDHSAISSDVVKIWGYSEKASGGIQTIAALRYYGLIVSVTSGHVRKLKFSDRGRNYFLDERPEKHAEAHKFFALHPKAMMALWEEWKAAPPAEPIARSALKVDFGYSENNARELLAIYLDNIQFAELGNADKISAGEADSAEPEDEPVENLSQRSESARVESTAPVGGKRSEYRVGMNFFHDQPPAGMRREVITLDEGDVVITFPDGLSPQSFGDLKDHLDLFIKKMQRRASAMAALTPDVKAKLIAAGIPAEKLENLSLDQIGALGALSDN